MRSVAPAAFVLSSGTSKLHSVSSGTTNSAQRCITPGAPMERLEGKNDRHEDAALEWPIGSLKRGASDVPCLDGAASEWLRAPGETALVSGLLPRCDDGHTEPKPCGCRAPSLWNHVVEVRTKMSTRIKTMAGKMKVIAKADGLPIADSVRAINSPKAPRRVVFCPA